MHLNYGRSDMINSLFCICANILFGLKICLAMCQWILGQKAKEGMLQPNFQDLFKFLWGAKKKKKKIRVPHVPKLNTGSLCSERARRCASSAV